MKITDHLRESYGIIYLQLMKKNQKMSTYNRLDLDTLEFWPFMCKILTGCPF